MTAGPIAPTITMPAGSYTTNRDTTQLVSQIAVYSNQPTTVIMHNCSVFAHQECVWVIDGEIISALDTIRERDVENGQSPIIRRLDSVAHAQVLRRNPACVFDIPKVVVSDFEY